LPTASPAPATETPSDYRAAKKSVAAMVAALVELLRTAPRASINVNAAALPNDPGVLQLMVVELMQALRQNRRDLEEVLRRLDAILRRRTNPSNPDQPSLFGDVELPEPPAAPLPPPVENDQVSRRGQCKPHGRRRPSRELRREPRRYELSAAERLCPDCGEDRQQIGVETTEQYDYSRNDEFPAIVFDYTTTHARDGPAAFLKGFKGFLQADAYSVYDGIYLESDGAIAEVGCWAHARNKFKDAQSSDPERVLAAKAFVRRLYDVEDEVKAKKLSADERLRLRQEKSVPVLELFLQWLLKQKA
jgi:hypothetical protein